MLISTEMGIGISTSVPGIATNLSKKADLSNQYSNKCHFFMQIAWHSYCEDNG
jgi:hypothetical protein